MDWRDLNSHKPQSQCGALPVKLQSTEKSWATKGKWQSYWAISARSKQPESNRRPFEFYLKRSDQCSRLQHSPEVVLNEENGDDKNRNDTGFVFQTNVIILAFVPKLSATRIGVILSRSLADVITPARRFCSRFLDAELNFLSTLSAENPGI